MRECTVTDNPLISIVLAVYEPNLDWLREQLVSLNNQTYENLELIVLDDCSKQVSYEEICVCVQEHITNFPYRLDRNESNLGSNQTFKKLTLLAKGKYIAYCDQDDIWKENKLAVLEKLIAKTGAQLVCSDAKVIDAGGNLVADSITKVRRRHIFYAGEHLQDKLLFRNFVIGCTMLIDTAVAKEAIPFVENMVHDHWLALYASSKGRIEVYEEPLVTYRLHSENQTRVMAAVVTKTDYYKLRIAPYCDRMAELEKRLGGSQKLKEALKWAQARKAYYLGQKGAGRMVWRYRHLDWQTSLFELVAFRLPNSIFGMLVGQIQKGRI